MENKETIEKDPCNFCGKTLREQMKGCNEITCYRQFLNKQETLEEAAERLFNKVHGGITSVSAFKKGAKWQAERMYSEEDIKSAYNEGAFAQLRYRDGEKWVDSNEWFEEFKKK
jgi:hypothetical protein